MLFSQKSVSESMVYVTGTLIKKLRYIIIYGNVHIKVEKGIKEFTTNDI